MNQAVKPRGPHRYQKGNPKKGGRQLGSGNKIPKLIKDCVVLAAELEGSNQHGKDGMIGFLRRVARDDITSFAGLLKAVMGHQIENNEEAQVEVTYRSVAEIRRELASRGIDMEVVARIMQEPITTIDAKAVDDAGP